MLFSRSSLIASTLAVLCFQTSQAHVSLSPKFAEPGVTNFTTSFNVPHGCNGSSTISIQVTVPEEITTLSPQAISNWVSSWNAHTLIAILILFCSRLFQQLTVIQPIQLSILLLGQEAPFLLLAHLVSLLFLTFPMKTCLQDQTSPYISLLFKLGNVNLHYNLHTRNIKYFFLLL